MASQINIATDNVMSQYFYLKNAPNLWINHTLILICLIYRKNLRHSCRIKEKRLPFPVLHMSAIQTLNLYYTD